MVISFFLEPENIGESRAQATSRYLRELNSDVQGDYIDTSLEELLGDRPEFFNSFTIIIASNLPEK